MGTPVLRVSGTGTRLDFDFPSAGSTLQGFKILKLDKTGEQNIIDIQASNTTITNNEFQGQYVFGDPDVSRAMRIFVGAMTGLSITNNVIHDLRQPAYMSGTNTGTISGNYTYRTRGWVVEGGNLVFTGNTWGVGANQNIFDIAILSAVGPGPYPDIPGMAAANNNAFIEDQRTLPATLSIVYVSPSGSLSNTGTAISPKQTIQQGVDRAVIGGSVHVLAGTYNEDVNVTKAGVKLLGAGIGNTIVSGPSGGAGSTFQIAAAGVLMDGFSITRDGNAVGTWNDPLNTAGVAIQSQGNTVELRNSHLYGNRTGVDVNNSNGNNIHNNIIDNNRTGLIFRNQTDNTQLKNNFITNNWTVGIVFLDASGGANVPVQQALTSNFNENDLSGNWYGAVDDRQEGGALPADGANLKNFENNYWGVIPPTVNTGASSEPGYAAQIPVIYGGVATNPGGASSVYGPAEQNVDYQPFLCSGVDASPVIGFQPVFGCGDIEIVAPATANVGDTGIAVQVVGNNAINLYGVQVTITYDPQLVLTGYTLGPTLGPGFPLVPTPFLLVNVPGSLTFAFTQIAPNPAASGSGLVLATLTFGAVGAGTANVAVSPGAVFSNDQGFQIGPNAVVNDSIIISGAATTVNGTILLQGRTNHSGATAQIDPPGGPISPATSSVGGFTISGPSVGAHTLEAVMLGYLKAVKPFGVAAGANAAGSVTLIGGDANMSGTINILDLSLVAAYFGQSPAYAPPLAPNTTPDINGDNVVNILDLSLTAANFGSVGPTVWP